MLGYLFCSFEFTVGTEETLNQSNSVSEAQCPKRYVRSSGVSTLLRLLEDARPTFLRFNGLLFGFADGQSG